MATFAKDTFYREHLYQYSVYTSTSDSELRSKKPKKEKEVIKNPLTSEMLEKGLSNFGSTPDGCNYAFLSVFLSKLNVASVQGLENYKYLTKIDVSCNSLTTLKPLSGLKYLTHLIASHNRFTKLLDFKVPLNLIYVDFSYNEIEDIPNLEKHRFLTTLELSHNKIKKIEGMEKNMELRELFLNYNCIEEIENLDGLNLTNLQLMANKIRVIGGLNKLPFLRSLNLSRNHIVKLCGLVDLIAIRNLYLTENKIKNVRELLYLSNLSFLSVLDLCFNPIQTRRYYRFQVLYRLPQIRMLDGVNITPEECVKAENLYGMDLEDRKRIFKHELPEEDFIDRRIHLSELIEPETDSNNEDINFLDTYDKEGNIVTKTDSLRKNKSTPKQTAESFTNTNNPLLVNSMGNMNYKQYANKNPNTFNLSLPGNMKNSLK